MEPDPIKKFKTWWDKAINNSSLNQKNAVCLSTINEDGFPSGRFVDLKGITNRCFIFCTSLESKKAQEIFLNPNVALTFWWDHVGFQIRITGTANVISDRTSELHWKNRSRKAQITSVCSNQSKVIDEIENLNDKIHHFKKNLSGKSIIPKPSNWGCFKIHPIQIEFLTFNENRLHLRELYRLEDEKWRTSLLQP